QGRGNRGEDAGCRCTAETAAQPRRTARPFAAHSQDGRAGRHELPVLQEADACDRRRDFRAARRDPGPIPGNCHRPRLACRACERIVEAPAPEHLIKSGLPTEAMVASVLLAKYRWHLPLYRQAKMLAAQGLDLDRSTLAFWVGYAAAELMPLYERLK